MLIFRFLHRCSCLPLPSPYMPPSTFERLSRLGELRLTIFELRARRVRAALGVLQRDGLRLVALHQCAVCNSSYLPLCVPGVP